MPGPRAPVPFAGPTSARPPSPGGTAHRGASCSRPGPRRPGSRDRTRGSRAGPRRGRRPMLEAGGRERGAGSSGTSATGATAPGRLRIAGGPRRTWCSSRRRRRERARGRGAGCTRRRRAGRSRPHLRGTAGAAGTPGLRPGLRAHPELQPLRARVAVARGRAVAGLPAAPAEPRGNATLVARPLVVRRQEAFVRLRELRCHRVSLRARWFRRRVAGARAGELT